MFGSSASGLAFKDADIDLYADMGTGDPHACADSRKDVKLFWDVANHFKNTSWMTDMTTIPKARVPMIKFCCGNIDVDLNFSNGFPVQNTALINLFTRTRNWTIFQKVSGISKNVICEDHLRNQFYIEIR